MRFEWKFAHREVGLAPFAHHQLHSAIAGFAQPAGQRRTVGQSQLDFAAAGASIMLFGGQRPVDPGRGDLEDIGRRTVVDTVQQLGCRAGQLGDRIEIQAVVTVGYHGDARRTYRGVDDHVFDFVACARELTVEQLDHLFLRR